MSSSVKESRDRISGGSSVLCAVANGSGVGFGSVPSLLLVLSLLGLCVLWASVFMSSQGGVVVWSGGLSRIVWCGGCLRFSRLLLLSFLLLVLVVFQVRVLVR